MLSKTSIKYIQSLQHKKFRDEYHAFVAEGPKLVNELLSTQSFICRNVFAVEEWVNQLDAKTKVSLGDKLEVVMDFELAKIASFATPNNVVAIFEKKKMDDSYQPTGRLTLVLDDIQDPGNFGTIIRTADWFGVSHIVCSNNTVDMYNSKVVQSTMASLARVTIIYTDLVSWLGEKKGVKKYATTINGNALGNTKGIKEAIIIIGNEANGISAAVLQLADENITIPKIGHAESLNAAVATGIVLHSFRQ